MNTKIKIILVYLLLGSAIRILSLVLRNAWFDGIITYLLVAVVCAMLFHFGKAMQSKKAQKKYYIYIAIIIGQAILFHFSAMFLSVDITVLDRLTTAALFTAIITLLVMFLDIAKVMEATSEKTSFFLRVIAVCCLIILIPAGAIFFLG